MRLAASTVFAAISIALVAAGCAGSGSGAGRSNSLGGDSSRAPALIASYGCGSCHFIPGIDGADANVGPPLSHFSDRLYIAGRLPNTPANLVAWIQHPQEIEPGTVMPDMGVPSQAARDIATYLDSH